MKTPHTNQERQAVLLTADEIAARYSISLREVRRLTANGFLPTVRLGRRCVRIPVEAADRAMLELATGGEK